MAGVADERLRRLERQAQSGDLEAGAQLLRERLRLGEVTPLGLRVAAFVGHPAARAAAPEVAAAPEGGEAWAAALWAFGRDLGVRAAVALGRALLPWFEEQLPGDRRGRRAVEAAEAWLACPCETCRVAARLASEDAAELEATAVDLALADGAVFAATVLSLAALVAGELRDAHAPLHLARALVEAETALAEAGRAPGSARAIATAALLGWALPGAAPPELGAVE